MTEAKEDTPTKNRNKNLHSARSKKDDEFYTRLYDVEMELRHYEEHVNDKIVFCNCDDPNWSSFVKYFALNFERLGLKKIISTHYEREYSSYKLEIAHQVKNVEELDKLTRIPLRGNGDFRSPECIELLEESDIVCTNPPFSLFREYLAQLLEYKKKFLILGNSNAISYNEVFPTIMDNKMWLGYGSAKTFMKLDGSIRTFGNIVWFTNLPHKKRNEFMLLSERYYGNEDSYPKYDNYDAIEVGKTIRIPIDYEGAMGVPISFLSKHNPEQFELFGKMTTTSIDEFNYGYPYIDGRKVYARILIRHRQPKLMSDDA